jgi:shikimate kinase
MEVCYMNIIIAGPCGVGKSTISSLLAQQTGMRYLDFDELRATKNSSACSLSSLNILECLSQELDNLSVSFLLDIGGGTVFRPNTNNDERLKQIQQLKNKYSAKVVILTAKKDVLFERYINTETKGKVDKEKNTIYFNRLWSDWLTFEQPRWQECHDINIDTSSLTVDGVIGQIKAGVNMQYLRQLA